MVGNGIDRLIWKSNTHGIFTVKSAARCLSHGIFDPQVRWWNVLWSLKIHERSKPFLWRVACNGLPMGVVLARRGLVENEMCKDVQCRA